MDTQYKMSVVVVTYNPSEIKLLETLSSIILQKGLTFQIVVADDGSADPCFDQVEAFFARHSFTDYVIVRNPENKGTVRNLISGVERCTGEYVKTISPGDMLSGEYILRDWVDAAEQSSAQMSFSDAVCYEEKDGIKCWKSGKAHPQTVDCYLFREENQIRWNYLIFGDLVLGAAIICHRDLLSTYLHMINGKVIYAEDNIYRLMAYDHITMHYFPEDAVIYELGSGISTSGNDIWKQRLKNDWDACTKLLLQRCKVKTQLDIALKISSTCSPAKTAMKLWRVLTNKRARQYWKARKQFRTTGQTLPEAFLAQIHKTINTTE